MEVKRVWGVSIAELERALREAEPAALLVPGRILRRVIKQDAGIPGAGLRVPHRKTYVVDSERLLALADADELYLDPNRYLPRQVLLIVRPEAEKLAAMTRSRALVKYWRLLFHARIDAALKNAVAEGRFPPIEIRRRIQRIGQDRFAEISIVLKSDEWLLPPEDDRTVYLEFIALYYELKFFAPRLISDYFPSLDVEAIDEVLAADIEAAKLYEQTRLDGAPEPSEASPIEDEESLSPRKFDLQAIHPRKQSERLYCKLMDRADRARSRGNDVRSAMLRTKAALAIGPKLAVPTRAEGRADLTRLAHRLQEALGLDEAETAQWAEALADLLSNAIRALWTPEARLLYDVQKVCIDHERDVYTLDLVSWAISLGRRPIRRQLPAQREVLMSKHLHAAAGRLRTARLPPDRRRRLSHLLNSAVHHSERKLRDTLRPRIAEALDDVELRPTNVPEIVARRKLIEELLDSIVDHGFLTIGEVRDAVARNNLKIRDVTVARGLLGDQILEADGRLAVLLDGVYRRAEVYLRLPQVLSAFAFGTAKGRFLTRYVFVPFGGAFLAIEFLRHISHSVQHYLVRTTVDHTVSNGSLLLQITQVLVLGVFLLGLLHRPAFRETVKTFLWRVWRGARAVVIDLPAKALEWPPLRRFIDSNTFKLIKRFVVKPLFFTVLLLGAMRLLTQHPGHWGSRATIFVAINLLLNSRIGRNVDELVTDWAVRGWHQLRIRVFAAIFRFIVDTFSQLLEGLERLLYAVDEWLRFRSGDLRIATATKAVLGVVWFFVAYVIRFCVTLLIEPQINPIKHFPVVTVSHKIILPFSPVLARVLESQLGFGTVKANTIAGAIIVCIPGIFGFLVWELKENWRVFAANRPETLRPVMVGRKGETMVRLLRSGFHSGTVPKLLTRLRRADRKAYATGEWTAPRKFRDKLLHVRQEVHNFVDRELIAILELSGQWRHGQLGISRVHLGLSQVTVELVNHAEAERRGHESAEDVMQLEFTDLAGWMVARATTPAWLLRATPEQAQSFATALAGLYKLSGVDLVAEQVRSALGPVDGGYRVIDVGLQLWPIADRDVQAIYSLRQERPLIVPVGDREAVARLHPVERQQLMFSVTEITWAKWVATWQQYAVASTSSSQDLREEATTG